MSPLTSSPIASAVCAMMSSWPQRGIPLGVAGRERVAPDLLRLLRVVEDRLPAVGQLGGQLDVLRAERGQDDRDVRADRVVDELQRLAESGALPGRQRDLIVRALVLQPLPAPHLAADLDQLAGPGQRRVVGNAVPALDDLRPGRADAQRETSAGDVVEAGRRHRRHRRRARVDLHDAGRQLDPLGHRGQIAKLADRVVTVGLRHEDDVQPGLFEVGQLSRRLLEAARVVQCHSDAHAADPFEPS